MTVIGNANNSDDPKNQKFKFIVAETKAKLMFDLASSHHQVWLTSIFLFQLKHHCNNFLKLSL